MQPKDMGPIRLTTIADSSDDEFNEPVTSALGKRDRLGGPSKGSNAKRGSSGEEAERPNKNRVSGVSPLWYSDGPDFFQEDKCHWAGECCHQGKFPSFQIFLDSSFVCRRST